MKKSLKKRVAAMFISIIVLTLFAIGIFHYAFMERFYTDRKQKILIESYETVNSCYGTDKMQSFMTYCSQNGLVFAVADENFTFAETNSRDGENMVNRMFGSVMNLEGDSTRIQYSTDKYKVVYFKDDADYLELFGKLDNGCYYVVRYPVAGIRDAVELSLRFYIVIGGIMLAVSCFIILRATKKIIKPIDELNVISKKMADLDFEARYTSGGEDEIGQLGENFNKMSDKLEFSISRLKSANLQLERDIREKEQIDERRREFLSNVSHDLKTPIALIQGYAEGLKEMSQDEQSREFYCDVIIDESHKMNRLVRQLLSLDRLESGQEEIDMIRFDLAELIRGVVNASSIVTKQKGIDVINDIPEKLFVWGDEMMIEEAFTNYFSNALNHVSGEMKIHITCAENDGIVTLTVFNTGKPIPEEDLDNIWSKFYKVDKARTREYGGSGIGLSIVKAIAERHSQKCWAENYTNGVAFKLTLSSK